MVIWPCDCRIPSLALDLQGMQTPPYTEGSGLQRCYSRPPLLMEISSNYTSQSSETLTPPLSSSTTIRRHSLPELLTIAHFLESLSRLQSLVGSTRKAIKADFGQLNVLSLEVRFQIYFDISRCNLNGLRIWEMCQTTLACRNPSTVWIYYPPSSGA